MVIPRAGLHFINSGVPADFPRLAVAKYVNQQPPAVPIADVVIFRWVEPFDVVNDWMPQFTPEDAAIKWGVLQSPHFWEVHPDVFLEGPNEPSVFDPQSAEWFAAFEVKRMKQMEALGFHCVVGNFSTGRPPLPTDDGGAVWTALVPMLRYAAANGHLLGLHEYGYTVDTWNLGRFRRVYDWLAWNAPDAMPDFVVTECGADGQYGPWLDDRYEQQFGERNAAYLGQLVDYDRWLRNEPHCKGAAVFSCGTGSDEAWRDFNLEGRPILGLLGDYIRSQQGADDGSGGGEMARFQKGDRAVLSGWQNLINGDTGKAKTRGGSKIGLAAGTVVEIAEDGPRTNIPSREEQPYWKVSAGETGYVEDKSLLPFTGVPAASRFKIRLADHSGQPHFIFADTRQSRYLKKDASHDAQLTWIGGGWAYARGYEYVTDAPEKGWMIEVEQQADGGVTWWGNDEPQKTAWVLYRNPGAGEDRLLRLEVAKIPDVTGDLPNFEGVPSDEPPDPPPPTPPPAEPPPVEPPADVDTTGQIPDGGFERGAQDGENDYFLPVGWDDPWFADESTPLQPGQDSPFDHRPHFFVQDRATLTADVQAGFPEGNRCLFVRGVWFPVWVRVPRRVTLEAGTYIPQMHVFPDPVAEYNPKRYGQDPITSRFRLYVDDPAAPFVDLSVLAPGRWQEYTGEPQTVTAGEHDVVLEYLAIFGMRSNGAFFDNVRLLRMDAPPPPTEPPPTGGVDVGPELQRIEALAAALENRGIDLKAEGDALIVTAAAFRLQAALIRGKVGDG